MEKIDTSNGASAMEIGEEGEDRPIMLLLKRLIKNKQNTIMTNTQILQILQKEFDIDIETKHELEVDIFIKVVKKFLKDWPQWEELERMCSRLYNLKAYQAINNVLKHKYKNLKQYLGTMIEAAKPIAKNAVDAVILEENKMKKESSTIKDSDGEPVLKVTCTRYELIHLIKRHPNGDLSNDIFNTFKVIPKRITYNFIPLESILDVWCFRINIVLNTICYSRELKYNYEHTLINKARNQNNEQMSHNEAMEEGWMLLLKKKAKVIGRKEIVKEFKDISLSAHKYDNDFVRTVMGLLKEDLEDSPEYLKLATPYKKYCNKYKYVRYLYNEQDNGSDEKYDLQLEETVAPMLMFCISKFSKSNPLNVDVDKWIFIDCILCNKQIGVRVNMKDPEQSKLKQQLIDHYNECHQHNEPDWTCTNCKSSFSIPALADSKWWHAC